MKPNVDIIQFFNHFEIVVDEKRAKDLSCVYESSHKLARLKYVIQSLSSYGFESGKK